MVLCLLSHHGTSGTGGKCIWCVVSSSLVSPSGEDPLSNAAQGEIPSNLSFLQPSSELEEPFPFSKGIQPVSRETRSKADEPHR